MTWTVVKLSQKKNMIADKRKDKKKNLKVSMKMRKVMRAKKMMRSEMVV
jgi:hypothetical protein